jgi:hypothetical protein
LRHSLPVRVYLLSCYHRVVTARLPGRPAGFAACLDNARTHAGNDALSGRENAAVDILPFQTVPPVELWDGWNDWTFSRTGTLLPAATLYARSLNGRDLLFCFACGATNAVRFAWHSTLRHYAALFYPAPLLRVYYLLPLCSPSLRGPRFLHWYTPACGLRMPVALSRLPSRHFTSAAPLPSVHACLLLVCAAPSPTTPNPAFTMVTRQPSFACGFVVTISSFGCRVAFCGCAGFGTISTR